MEWKRALSAPVRRHQRCIASAGKKAVLPDHHLGCRLGRIYRLWDMDFYPLQFQMKRDGAQLQNLTGIQNLFSHRSIIDQRPICRLQVSHQHPGFAHCNLAMKTGNGRVRDPEIIGGIATESVQAGPQIQIQRQSNSPEDVANHGRIVFDNLGIGSSGRDPWKNSAAESIPNRPYLLPSTGQWKPSGQRMDPLPHLMGRC